MSNVLLKAFDLADLRVRGCRSGQRVQRDLCGAARSPRTLLAALRPLSSTRCRNVRRVSGGASQSALFSSPAQHTAARASFSR
jgi:hypothetical protein